MYIESIARHVLAHHSSLDSSLRKSKITKILNSEENSKRKFLNQMANSKSQTHQTNGEQLSYS